MFCPILNAIEWMQVAALWLVLPSLLVADPVTTIGLAVLHDLFVFLVINPLVEFPLRLGLCPLDLFGTNLLI